MKSIILASVAIACLLPSEKSLAKDVASEPQYCSAETIDRQGNYRMMVRVECDGPYAGRCLKELKQDNVWDYQIVDMSECALKAEEILKH